jgi:arabinan endo-1,5-alpha-L-arabinosidase
MIRRVRFVWLVVLLLAACDTGQQASQPTAAGAPSAAPIAQAPTATSAPAPTSGPTPIPTPGPDEFANPIIDRDFPDPDVLKVGDVYYAYATNSAGKNIQTAKSTDLVTWELLDDALPLQPAWAALNFGLIWAPEVTTWDDGETFTMYFTARDTASNKQCIGVATSDKPEGPFKPDEEKAFICQPDQGGSIDASSFKDEDGSQYLLWKNDGNCCGQDTWLYLQKVATDGLTLEGEPARLIKQDQAWEGNLIEAPTLWKHNSKYYLFYSANNYAGVDYAAGYAVADTITGPYTKPLRQPVLATDMQTAAALGPGGQDIVIDKDGDTWMLYHSWDPSVSYRRVMLDELVWEGETPVVKGPDKLAQPRP